MSRASSRASLSRRPVVRRPTIGAPSDFRKVEFFLGRIEEEFRPLELSIYLPGNELPSLPTFSHDDTDGHERLRHPAPTLTKARSESLLSRPSTSFTIARKPISSRALSFDGSRSSFDSRYGAAGDANGVFGTRSIYPRPSIATTQSTLDFLDTLDSRMPQLPSRSRLRSKSGPEPVYTLYRRASEQSLRLRTHLEERERIERRLPDCDTIVEEKQMGDRRFPNLSPISSHGDPTDNDHELPSPRPRAELAATITTPDRSSSSPPGSHTSGDTLRASKLPAGGLDQPTMVSRITQWLLRSASSRSSPSFASGSEESFTRRPPTICDRTSTVSSTDSMAETVDATSPWSSPRTTLHRKGSSVSSWQTSMYCRGWSIDAEKRPAMPSLGLDAGVCVGVGVGIAF